MAQVAHPVRGYVAAVFGRGKDGRETQGSGYLLMPRVVLTAGHVVAGAAGIRAVVPGGAGPVPCRLAWVKNSEECDVALLIAERDLVADEAAVDFDPVVLGLVDGLRVFPGAEAVGYPDVQRGRGGELDSEQFVGTYKPGSNMLGSRHVLDSAHAAPQGAAGGVSPWAGMSGAPVFVNGLLAGVVCEVPGGWGNSRLALTPVRALASDTGFLGVSADAGFWPETRELLPSQESEVAAFEGKFRDYVVRTQGALTIVGLTLSDGEGEAWPLDVAYLSLEVTAASGPMRSMDWGGDGPSFAPAPASLRAADALSGRQRVLLRGTAGSGKTTLMQWLAVASARDGLPPELADLRGCVPLLLPLRTLLRKGEPLPEPEDFLRTVARPLAGLPAARGWVSRKLDEGRALLLIDGVDEVPEAERKRTLAWLKDLLVAYPEARYVVTTRPSAVRDGWLADLGFAEMELLPMSRGDVAAFIDRWHAAAACDRDDERLPLLRDALKAAVVAKPDLGRLATNPLMCAMICALNRSRNGFLPNGRMELYRAGLELLLVRRDREREVLADPEGLELDPAEQVALLQKLAYWLVINGRSEIEWDKAVTLVERALPAMPRLLASGSAEQVLRRLVLRSGLLRQPTSETLDFIHRTFQDYLGAQAAVDDMDFDLLVGHAHEDQWEDVLRMAVGYAAPRGRTELLRKLLERGEREAEYRDRMRLLAAACLHEAAVVDPQVREEVQEATAELVPPPDQDAAKALAGVGAFVLDLLPGPEGLTEEQALAVATTATVIGDDRAIPLLSQYATHDSMSVRAQLAWSWHRFDVDRYADAVVGRLRYEGGVDPELRFVARSTEHLKALKRLGGRPMVEVRDLELRDCVADLVTPALQGLTLRGQTAVDLRDLRVCPPLRKLDVYPNRGVTYVRSLNATALESLSILAEAHDEELEVIASMDRLRRLHIGLLGDASEEPRVVPLPPGLRSLSLHFKSPHKLRPSGIAAHSGIERVTFSTDVVERDALALHTLRGLRVVAVHHEDLAGLGNVKPLPQVTSLFLTDPVGQGLDCVPVVYPCLTKLAIYISESDPDVFDLAPLRTLGPIRVSLNGGRALNRELLAEGSEVTEHEYLTRLVITP
ncbi:NACHT domain-containing protein [Streptomyces gamaensis]|uniref:NACHT domain-containing protein n=1 Tax=Streptomyces gamaensis TaxID=1763542 RepID=A0ABW0Z168_9ACTN